MNYIKHLNKAFEILFDDDRLSSMHITLYFSLFQIWNYNRFKNPFTINRVEIMRASRIKSNTTYIRCLKELEEYGFIEYKPSFNSIRGTKISLFPLSEDDLIEVLPKGLTNIIPPDVPPAVMLSVKPTVQPDVKVLYINNHKQNKHIEGNKPPTHEEIKIFFTKKKTPRLLKGGDCRTRSYNNK